MEDYWGDDVHLRMIEFELQRHVLICPRSESDSNLRGPMVSTAELGVAWPADRSRAPACARGGRRGRGVQARKVPARAGLACAARATSRARAARHCHGQGRSKSRWGFGEVNTSLSFQQLVDNAQAFHHVHAFQVDEGSYGLRGSEVTKCLQTTMAALFCALPQTCVVKFRRVHFSITELSETLDTLFLLQLPAQARLRDSLGVLRERVRKMSAAHGQIPSALDSRWRIALLSAHPDCKVQLND